jgi:uncharacterized protein YlxW (UPF0749 family)
MDGIGPVRRPWLVRGAALVLAAVLAYLVFGVYIPSMQRMARLEQELRDVYTREADLQLELARAREQNAALQRQVTTLTAERDRFARRLGLRPKPPVRTRPRPPAARPEAAR